MNKKITALFLAILMLVMPLAIYGCGDGDKTPIESLTDDTDAPGSNTQPSDDEKDTEEETEPTYEPDPDAKFPGAAGVGSLGATVYFDKIKISSIKYKLVLYENDFSGENPLEGMNYDVYSGYSWDKDTNDFSVKALEEAEGAEADYVLAFEDPSSVGSLVYFGDPKWNYLQYSVRVMISDIGQGGAVIYFGYVDSKNYFALEIGAENNTKLNVYRVENGNKSLVDSMPYKAKLDEWFAVGINMKREDIDIYVASTLIFSLYKEYDPEDAYWGGVGLGSWLTAQSWDNLVVKSNETGEILYQNDFSDPESLTRDFVPKQYSGGSWGTIDAWTDYWVIEDDDEEHGKVLKLNTAAYSGCVVMVADSIGNQNYTNYTIDVDVRRDSGAEAWLVFFNGKDDKNYVMWNIGGWGNSKTAYETIFEGSKSTGTQIDDMYEMNQWYHVTLIVKPNAVYGYVDGVLKQVYTG